MKIISILSRVAGRVRRAFKAFGIGTKVRETLIYSQSSPSRKRLLIIASGDVSIPPDGWGAVETIISETIPIYLSEGFEVMIVNSKAIQDLYRARAFNPAVILVHDDIVTRRTRLIFGNIPIITVTHYGLAASEDLWHSSYRKVLKKVAAADYIVCLNPRIKVQLSKYIEPSKLIICPNGSSFHAEPVAHHNHELICVGKVEPRKKQYELYKTLSNSNRRIKFVGEVTDERVKDALRKDALAQGFFVGAWNRTKLVDSLSHFEALILISSGEADALVLYEAQIAGLPILVTSDALGSQDASLDWIQEIPDNPTQLDIEIALSNVSTSHFQISEYAKANYTWEKRNSILINLIKQESNRN